MLQLDATFSEKAYGSSSFSDFVEKLRNGGYVNVSGGEGRYIIERKGVVKQEKPAPRPDEALPMLRDVLETHRLEMEEGCLAENLEGWVQSDHPGFDPLAYGFQEFAEFLNFAQDKLVQVEPDEEKGLLVYLGAEFYPPAVPEPPAEEAVEVEEPQPIVKGQPSMIPEPEPKPQRRTRRKPAGEKRATDAKPRRRRAPTRSRIPNPAV
jgi:hypothetical protein